MISIASALAAFFKLVLAFIGWQNREAHRRAGAAEAVLKGSQQADETISAANNAREAVRSELARDPAKLRDPDEFRRPD